MPPTGRLTGEQIAAVESWIKLGALLVNVAVVLYMTWLLTENKRRKAAEEKNRGLAG